MQVIGKKMVVFAKDFAGAKSVMESVPVVFDDRFVGAHMPISGGLCTAFERIRSVGGTAMQLFSRNQRQWTVPELGPEVIHAFARAWGEWGAYPVFIHDSYLVNLAGPKGEKVQCSVDAFAQEVCRAHCLSVKFLVTHPGSHLGTGVVQGLQNYVANLDRALEQSGVEDVTILLETTAGQGTNLGSRFEELVFVLEHSFYAHRLGICFDTCHAFAAGYDFRSARGFHKTFERLDQLIGLDRIGCFHLNDAKLACGSHKDRHEHIGRGKIGTMGFTRILQEPMLKHIPMILETPKGKVLEEDRMNLAVLKGLADRYVSR